MLWKKIFPVCTCFCVVRPLDYAHWGLAVNQFAILFDGRVPGFN